MNITGPCTHFSSHDETPRLFHGRRIPRTWVMVIDRKKVQIFNKLAEDLELIGRAEPEPADIAFAHSLAVWLEEAYVHDAFDRLVLVAAPRMLGELRKNIPESLHGKIVSEISKDMANLSIQEIKRHLSNVVYFKDRDFTPQGRKTALFS